MTTKEHLEGHWREWRHQRIATLTRPYGWASLVAQHWLEEGEDGVELESLPGQWSVRDSRVIYTPPSEGANLSVDGHYPVAPVEIVPGRNMVYSNGDSVPVYFGECEVDTVVRTNDAGSKIFAVRVRDPREAARKDLSSLDTFDYDPAWRVPAVYEPLATLDVEASTVETGVRETTSVIGRLSFELEGKQFVPLVIGKETPSGIQPVLQIRDASSGKSTYGAGRVVDLEFVSGTRDRIDYVDFNYLAALPCAFTNFVTCPIAPPENHIPVEISAGEKKPAEVVARVATYAR
ncbi:DUF1684 domain-containing protein [Ornithinimicrobium murale]|uniref:DUF1684 domain-containing protein n=1 Tax=Ornithinimicrobium murale TaxID=1050153 RepID=UPI000E0D8F92|nr:DUF1684 domain-containing protein [Ornithinimicrobium murale]